MLLRIDLAEAKPAMTAAAMMATAIAAVTSRATRSKNMKTGTSLGPGCHHDLMIWVNLPT